MPLENKQFALFLCLERKMQLWTFLYLRLVHTIRCIMRACVSLPISATQSLAFLWILFFKQPLRKSNGLNEPERKCKERKRDVWGKINGFTLCRSRRKARQQGLYLLKWLLFGREARGKNAPSWWGFSSLSKIDFCIHKGKVERSWGACRVPPLASSLLWGIMSGG